MQTTIGHFSEVSRAHDAIDALFERKYDRADIIFVVNDGFGEVTMDRARASSATNGVLGFLLGLGAMTIPGVGPILAAGPLAVGLAGATAGAVQQDAGWPDAFARFGVPAEQARVYGEAIRAGGALVLVRGSEALVDNIQEILESCGAVSVQSYLNDWEA